MDKRVKKLSKKEKKIFSKYAIGLILTVKKKSCSGMKTVVNENHDCLYRVLCKIKKFIYPIKYFSIEKIKQFSQVKSGNLIIDDTAIPKRFSRFIEGVFYIYSVLTRTEERALTIIVLSWSNGSFTVPLGFKFFIYKAVAEKDIYKTKSELGIELIKEFYLQVPFDFLLMDGHYSTKFCMLPFLYKHKIPSVLKIARDRKIRTKDGIEAQLQKHPGLKLMRNSRHAVVFATFGEGEFYFSSHKRKRKDGSFETIYLISTISMRAKEYIKIYAERWAIEKMFRTMKQSLGLSASIARKIENQAAHIHGVFFAYTFLQDVSFEFNYERPEDAVTHLQDAKLTRAWQRMTAFNRNFGYVA